MIQRFKRYFENHGPVGATFNILIMLYVFSIAWRVPPPVGYISAGCAVALFLLPWLFLGLMVRRVNSVIRVVKYGGNVCVLVILLDIVNAVTLPLLAFIAAILFLWLANGVEFWLLSDRRVYTSRASTKALERLGHGDPTP